ncbi:hypothetical protein Nepgr_022446 [Nepenthes gracilis]|uniref:RRM domain-containing protein n=1 Tax=Nepenthes gracilis TaxID=150966 RepID=A0AAD3T0S5_NEPGR|nr:hypothetical protein Nepgr_022446 [Nepenthes gracilis]
MESNNRVDDRTFRVNFSGGGVEKLRELLNDKLEEFMGEYTDGTLVEYVIVLLRNGRSKDEAKSELDVFLGDDSDSFVTWLWDHLASNIDQYIQSRESGPDKVSKVKPALVEHAAKNVSQKLDVDSERGKLDKVSRNRHNREWKGLVRDETQPPLCSSQIDDVQKERETHHDDGHMRQSVFFERPGQEKRSHPDEQEWSKSEDVSQEVCSRRLRSVARVPNAMATAIKAIAEAAEDVSRVKPKANVFDRLSHGVDESDCTVQAINKEEYEDYDQIQVKTHKTHPQRSSTMIEFDSRVALDSASDNEANADVNVMGHRFVGSSQIGMSDGKKGDSLMVKYSEALNAHEAMQPTPIQDQDSRVAMANASRKVVNISVNVNTWKAPLYNHPMDVKELKPPKSVHQNEIASGKSNVRSMKESSNPRCINGNGMPAVDTQNGTPNSTTSAPGLHSTGCSLDDSDSRTIFVNNVNYAASKDSLSQHFNKFGKVLKVIILTDAATGQPKGSAYVEFMLKEAAENALSLDGTSFMSRILKVVRKSAAHQDAAGSIMARPQSTRISPFAVSTLSRPPFPRVFRGARSLQWKRDAQPSLTKGVAAASNSNNVPSMATRGLTYVRIEPKANVNPSAA